MNITPHEVGMIPSTQRVVGTRDVNIVVELQKFEEKLTSIKRSNVENKDIFKAKVLLLLIRNFIKYLINCSCFIIIILF